MRPLVYLHPAGGVRPTKVLEKLDPHQPVFPGFDGTPTDPKINSRKELGQWVARYIEKLGQPCDVIGCSFGGAVALWLAIQRPELVDHLVLECPAGLQTIDAKLRADPAEFRKALFVHPGKAIAPAKTKEIEAANRSMLAHYGAEDGRDNELLERVREIRNQTLILHGSEDRIIGRESVQLLRSRLAKSFLVYVWDAAHNIEVDQPERMLELVEAILDRSDAFVVPRGG
ncbi:MAG TPA: alpha/beta hydrolase [Burkholderiales bacterium]|nr:alpha/beta hydrolase [Burkholderiales bacterium]